MGGGGRKEKGEEKENAKQSEETGEVSHTPLEMFLLPLLHSSNVLRGRRNTQAVLRRVARCCLQAPQGRALTRIPPEAHHSLEARSTDQRIRTLGL